MITEKIIQKLKRDPDYKWQNAYSGRDTFILLFGRACQLIRGLFYRFFFKKHKGFLFVGKRVTIKHCHHISFAGNLVLEDNVYINGLSGNGINLGENVSIGRDSIIICTGVVSHRGEGITIGNGTGINARAYLGGQGGITIGDNVIVGPDTKIFSENHNYEDQHILIKNQGVTRKAVFIKNNCWIGSGVTILAGVAIEEGCIIAAGSVVTKSFPANMVIGGVPAKIIRPRI